MNKLAIIGLSIAAALAVQSADAGSHYSGSITAGKGGAYGQVRAARQSADDKQFIGCAAYGATTSSAPTYVACSASDASGTAVYCATYNPSYYVWQAAMAVSEASSIIFNVDANYNCSYIYVSNNSTNL